MTFNNLMQAYLAGLGTKPSRTKYEQIYRQFFARSEWRDRDAASIQRYDVMLLRQSLEATKPHANKTIGLIKQAYSWAINRMDPVTKRPLYEGMNPAEGIKGYACQSRERLADRFELTVMLNGLGDLRQTYEALFALRFLVPCRIKELCGMQRADVDVNGKWTKGTTKNGRAHAVLIPSQAMRLLRDLPHKGEYYFPGCYNRPIREGSVRKVWDRWRTQLSQVTPSLSDLQLLDMRRVYASYLYTVIKRDELFVKAALNHYDPRPTAVYTRLNYDQIAEVGQQFADWMWSLRLEAHHDSQMDLLADTALFHHGHGGGYAGRSRTAETRLSLEGPDGEC